MHAEKCWVGILSQIATETVFSLQFIHILRRAVKKNIAWHHSYFMGHSQNELSHVHAYLCARMVSPPSPFLISCPS